MVQQIPNAGCKEILIWKLIYSVSCSVFSQVLFLVVFLFIMNFNIFHPVTWFMLTFSTLTSFSTWLYLIPLGSIIFAQGVICSKDYIFENSYRKSRILKILHVFSLRNLFMGSLHILTGVSIVWLYLSLLGGKYGSSYTNCGVKSICLIEENFFMMLNGLWIGLFYFVKQYLYEDKNIQFPVIQQGKLITIKSTITLKLKQAMREAVWPTVYFLGFYYYRGVNLRDWLVFTLDLEFENNPLSLFDLLNNLVLVYSWFFSTLFIFTMLCMRLFFEVFLTEHWTFPIESEYSHVLTIKEALAMNNIPVIQHLACLDFYYLSLWDPIRRQQLFTLSQPGGHPHNWNNIVQPVLKLISEFSTDLNKAADAILSPELPVRKEEPEQDKTTPILQRKDLEGPLSPFISQYGLRNMSLPRQEPLDLNIIQVKQNLFMTRTVEHLKSLTVDKWSRFVASLKRRFSILNYFFGEVPESRIYFLMTKGQPIIWAIQGLSFMVTASFIEDNYGVVQKDLPVIINTLIQLKQNLDKLNKVSVVNRKSSRSDVYKMQLKSALRTAVKRSLYNISNTFGEYLPQIGLNKDILLQMQTFVAYKEG